MKSKTLRIFSILSILLVLVIVIMQFYWIKKAYALEDKDFDQRVNNALRVVSKRLLNFNNNPNNQLLKPVERVSGNYYTVRINDKIDPGILEEFLKQELSRHDIKQNFEYGVYDCLKNDIVHGGYVCLSTDCDSSTSVKYQFPNVAINNYYFGLYFPDKKFNILSEMGTWVFSTILLSIIIAFLGYSFWVIFKQKRLSEIQNDFINNMTHEFKTPISTISISSEVLMNPDIIKKPERLLSYATIIRNEAIRLKKNVDTVLQTANISENTSQLNFENVSLGALVQNLIQNIEPVLKEKGAVIKFNSNSKNDTIFGDKLHLTNVLNTLIDNSIKYCDKKPNITLNINNQSDSVTIKIADNGLGISDKDQAQVFQKFFRVHTGNVHNVKGFGLGLFYVKEIINAHKAEIKLQSKLGVGSTFSIVFPLKK